MSLIAISGVPPWWKLSTVVQKLARAIHGNFEVLNFEPKKNMSDRKECKVCYIRLSDKLDPVRVVARINGTTTVNAYIPDGVPNIAIPKKPKIMSTQLRGKLRIREDETPETVMGRAIEEVMVELQSKYPALLHISKKTGHKVLESITKKIIARLVKIGEQRPKTLQSTQIFTQAYRHSHPQATDYALVMETIHAVEDAAGLPRTQIDEIKLSAMPPLTSGMTNIPKIELKNATVNYTKTITTAISNHLNSLNCNASDTDSADEIARKRVRQELKKMGPYFNQIVNEMLMSHFLPQKAPALKFRIYADPVLPTKEEMKSYLRRFKAMNVCRSPRMFNMLKFKVMPQNLGNLMESDGKTLNGSKLIIRPSDLPVYDLSTCAAMNNYLTGEDLGDDEEAEDMKDETNMDIEEDWSEEWQQ